MADRLHCGRFQLALDRALVMGIVNVTPDSFSDGNQYFHTDQAVAHARELIAQGADLLDIGGESTRPGAEDVPVEEELRRVMPVIEALHDCGVPLSIDTCKPEVMRAVLQVGVDMINDVRGFRDAEAVQAVAGADCGVCLMHMRGEPRNMQKHPVYDDVVAQVHDYLAQGAARLQAAGVAADRIVLDPGFGFGKTRAHNYALLQHLPAVRVAGYPLLIGLSRKSMIGSLTGRAAPERLGGSVAGALAAVQRGAHIVRVHDVAETVAALKVQAAVAAAA